MIRDDSRTRSVVDEVLELFNKRGEDSYYGEPVSQKEHALQAAALADQAGSPDSLVVAALLHDIGHLLLDLPEDIAGQGVDGGHEAAGERWLSTRFSAAVSEPVALHVDAKRYLCAVNPTYYGRLSPASILSLSLQGGPFTPKEAQAFERHPHYREAIRLRQWDDEAKSVDLDVPGLERYTDRIRTSARTADLP